MPQEGYAITTACSRYIIKISKFSVFLDFCPENVTNQTCASNLTSNGTWTINYTKNSFDYNNKSDLKLYDDEIFPGEGSLNETNIMVRKIEFNLIYV